MARPGVATSPSAAGYERLPPGQPPQECTARVPSQPAQQGDTNATRLAHRASCSMQRLLAELQASQEGEPLLGAAVGECSRGCDPASTVHTLGTKRTFFSANPAQPCAGARHTQACLRMRRPVGCGASAPTLYPPPAPRPGIVCCGRRWRTPSTPSCSSWQPPPTSQRICRWVPGSGKGGAGAAQHSAGGGQGRDGPGAMGGAWLLSLYAGAGRLVPATAVVCATSLACPVR